jgi:hypothetical protein
MKTSRHAIAVGVLLAAWPRAPAQDTTTLVSTDSSGAQGNDSSGANWRPSISSDDRFVAFDSLATNLVAGDTNGFRDVFVHDRSTGSTERVSVDSIGAEGNGASLYPSVSADGRFVAFQSAASNLVAGDTNGSSAAYDIFVRDRSTGTTERVSVDSLGVQTNGRSDFPSISADGRFVAFASQASNLVAGDTNSVMDVFVHDRSTGVTERVSVDSSGVQGDSACDWVSAISADGYVVAFASAATNLVSGDTNSTFDVFVHDRSSGVTERVSVDSGGADANAASYDPATSIDGQFVAFDSFASNLVAGDTNSARDVFVYDRSSGVTERVSVDSSGLQGNDFSYFPTISSDGEFVAFDSGARNLVSNDTNAAIDVFVHDRSTAVTERASVDSSGAEGDYGGSPSCISSDGQVVVFGSYATNLVASDTNGHSDVFAHERSTIDAYWSNYGAGFSGTNGVPALTAEADPIIGTTLAIDLANSYGSSTPALLFLGFQRAQIHSALGSDLLVMPSMATILNLPATGTSFSGAIPNDPALSGFVMDLQSLEADPGAAKGVSFTPGLELVLGH